MAGRCKGPYCGSQEGTCLGLLRRNLLFSHQEVFTKAFRCRPRSSGQPQPMTVHGRVPGPAGFCPKSTPPTGNPLWWDGWDSIRSALARGSLCHIPLPPSPFPNPRSASWSDGYLCPTLYLPLYLSETFFTNKSPNSVSLSAFLGTLLTQLPSNEVRAIR